MFTVLNMLSQIGWQILVGSGKVCDIKKKKKKIFFIKKTIKTGRYGHECSGEQESSSSSAIAIFTTANFELHWSKYTASTNSSVGACSLQGMVFSCDEHSVFM